MSDSSLAASPPGRFRHARSRLVVGAGAPNHRGRDLLVTVGAPQMVEAKFAYGLIDKDLKDEDVLVEVEVDAEVEGPGVRRMPLATLRTSLDAADDDGGRIRYALPPERALGVGRHRVVATVLGDGSQAELSVVVLPRGSAAFVSDIDGTLTVTEVAEFPALMAGRLPDVHPHAVDVFQRLAARGLVPIYLTARPEWLLARTRALLAANGFPPGIVCTRRDKSGGYGASAAAFKRAELERLATQAEIVWAFGNMPSDADAYARIVADPRRRVLYRYDDDLHGARRIETYAELLDEV